MALRDVDSESGSPHPVTPMAEIRQHKGMLFDEFTRENSGWQWSAKRRKCLMYDEQGRCWVPMFEPEHGVGIEYDPLYTPEVEEMFDEISRKAREDILAGRVTYVDEMDDDDDE